MFGLKNKINVEEQNLKEFESFKRNPVYFFEKCMPGFEFDKFNKDALLLSNDNSIHITGDRQAGTSTTLMLMALHRLIFSDTKTYIYVSSAKRQITKLLFDMLREAIQSLHDNTTFLKTSDIISTMCQSNINFKNDNKIMMINEGNFINQTRGISADFVIMLDECSYLDERKLNDINYVVDKYLNPLYNTARLYGN